jgi:exodeoxyribonuclease V beta subunit
MKSMSDWNPTAPESLQPGITLLEASAGTGKTYNITSLILRLVAERGLKMREFVVVTFTRAATAELKDRIRARIAHAVAVLEQRVPPGRDPTLLHLLQGASADSTWLRNLRAAQESFDECVISTLHGFCQRMLQQNAFEARTEFDLELLQDTSAVRDELVDDWLSSNLHAQAPARFAFLVHTCKLNRESLGSLAALALGDPDIALLPDGAQATPEGWGEQCEALVRGLQGGWGRQLAELVDSAQKRGAFAAGQRTFTKKRCTAELDKLTAWLASCPPLGSLPSTYWDTRKFAEKLCPGEPPLVHPALDAVRALGRYAELAIGCQRAAIVRWVREQFDLRMAARRVQSYQDLMRRLSRVLGDPSHPSRPALLEAIGSRFRVALIDEFQDTDTVQWTIFRELFGDKGHWLYLIGDPKQAIYGFRGANVHVYLAAKASARQRTHTMRQNFRSDDRLVLAFNHLMGRQGFFGEPGIPYVTVQAAPTDGAPAQRLRVPDSAPQWQAPLQLRFIDRRIAGATEVSCDDAPLGKGVAGSLVPLRVADDIVQLLQAGARLYDPRHKKTDGEGWRPLRPCDLAVLTRTGYQANHVQRALGEAGVPSVLQGADSVLASHEAFELQLWLEALASPGDDRAARAAATTRLFGRDGTLVAQVDAQQPEALARWEQWVARLAAWRAVMNEHGFLRAWRAAMNHDDLVVGPQGEPHDVTTRLLRRPDGERMLTNLLHLSELLHEAQATQRLRLPGLLAWLKRQRADATVDATTAESRLERDDEAVSIMTMHKSKGLQFPVVFVPFLWDGKDPEAEALLVPDADKPEQRLLDLRPPSLRQDSSKRAKLEAHKEQLRLLYVALTRAKLQCFVYAGHIKLLELSPLAPALHGESPEGGDRIEAGCSRASSASRAALWDDLQALADSSSAGVALSWCGRPKGLRWTAPQSEGEKLLARDFLRFDLARFWRRHSYSSLHAHGSPVDYEDPAADLDGEPQSQHTEARWLPSYVAPKDAPQVPLASFPAGTDAGTFLHEVFERADFEWAHPERGAGGEAELTELVRSLLPKHGITPLTPLEELVRGLLLVLRTPLGMPLRATRLCDVPVHARFNELRFDFPIAGGYGPSGGTRSPRIDSLGIVEALRHRKQVATAADELVMRSAWLAGLGSMGNLAGFMTGLIDLVFRHEVEGVPQWFIVDYKSNRLDPHRTRSYPVGSFAQEGMRYAMEQASYYLQYHIYLLALHRYLKTRMKDYDYELHVGGAYYLFIRGMVGPDTPLTEGRRSGCFFDKPPYSVIERLDKAFDLLATHPGGEA